MKIKILKDSRCAYLDPAKDQINLFSGTTVDVADEIAESMLKAKTAEIVKQVISKKEVKKQKEEDG